MCAAKILVRGIGVVVLVLANLALGGTPSSDSGSLKMRLRPQHPRVMMTAEQFERVQQTAQSDPLAASWEKRLIADAEKMLKQPPVEHVLIGPRLLDKSRTALQRISTLSALYRLCGDRRFADRAKKELFAVCAFADWNPSHFLDVAEMTTAVSLGYDWLYDQFSADERATVRRAIVDKGLKEGLKIYEKNNWWVVAIHNWNQVCNGGMTVGALAVADEEPQLCGRIIEYARQSIPRAMASFAPDGGWAEGPGYWGYATQYNVYYLASLETAMNTDFGLKKMPGFAECGNYRMTCVGPTGQTFDYADSHEGGGRCSQCFWLARTFSRPDYDAFERKMVGNRPDIFALLWFNPQFSRDASNALEHTPANIFFKGINVVFLRSDWQDQNAFFLGFKGGDNKANHAHLDLGTFVMDALGQRWANDLGADEYNMPGYFGKQRWTYYRLKSEGHNTITLDNGQNQATSATAPILAFGSSPTHPFAVADLSMAYRPRAGKVLRGVAITGRRQILIQDEIELAQPTDIRWSMHTHAKIDLAGKSATLHQGGVDLLATIVSPASAKFQVEEINLAKPQNATPNTRKLIVVVPSGSHSTTIVVAFTPAGQLPVNLNVLPLAKWGGQKQNP